MRCEGDHPHEHVDDWVDEKEFQLALDVLAALAQLLVGEIGAEIGAVEEVDEGDGRKGFWRRGGCSVAELGGRGMFQRLKEVYDAAGVLGM